MFNSIVFQIRQPTALFSCPLSLQPYLKSWSQDLGVPILSVDYSLAPEAPFPRALEECFYAYCWALRNPHLLGTKNRTPNFFGKVKMLTAFVFGV